MFSMILVGDGDAYYLNFQGNSPDEYKLDESALRCCDKLFRDSARIWATHNAKFEMHKLALAGYTLKGSVHCTYTAERVIRNNYQYYSLAACAKRRGWKKDNAVEDYIKKNNLFTWVDIPGKKRRDKQPHYDQVPFEIMSEYGMTDGILHRELALDQTKVLYGIS